MSGYPRELKCFHCGKPGRKVVIVIEKQDGAWYDERVNGWFDNKGVVLRGSEWMKIGVKRKKVIIYYCRKDNYLGNNKPENLIMLCSWCKKLHEGDKKVNISRPVEPELF